MTNKLGKQSLRFAAPPVIISTGTAVGPFEAQGPLKDDFDFCYRDEMAGEKSFEKAERRLMYQACNIALGKQNVPNDQVDYLFGGDLLNQIISAGFNARDFGIPFFGIYGACSTSVEGLILGAMTLSGGFGNLVLVATSSHNSTAERQFRYPTEYACQRKPYSQWTVTGAGAALLSVSGNGPQITTATVGKVADMACKDPLNMGAAMAPAAAATLAQHFSDTGRNPGDYDLILTGDLGKLGHEMTREWCQSKYNLDLGPNYQDCGLIIYGQKNSRVHAGGSGCGCAALTVFGHIYKRMLKGELKKVLFAATGALHSPISCQQGENIPCIAHAVSLELP